MVYHYTIIGTAQFYSHFGVTVLVFAKIYDTCDLYLDPGQYIVVLREIFSLQR